MNAGNLSEKTPYYLVIGEILRPHGVRGELRTRILTDYPERVFDLDVVHLGRDPMAAEAAVYHIQSVRFHQNYLLLTLKDIGDRDEADKLRGQLVMVDINNAVPLEEDEYYLYQLIGLKVETEAGQTLGTLADIMETGANDVYVIKRDSGPDILFPAHDDTVVEIDVEQGRIIVSPPDGLLT